MNCVPAMMAGTSFICLVGRTQNPTQLRVPIQSATPLGRTQPHLVLDRFCSDATSGWRPPNALKTGEPGVDSWVRLARLWMLTNVDTPSGSN